jgi:hypothetical protein
MARTAHPPKRSTNPHHLRRATTAAGFAITVTPSETPGAATAVAQALGRHAARDLVDAAIKAA